LTKYIIKRLLNAVLVVFVVISIVFFATKIMPSGLTNPKFPPAVRAQIEEAYGLREPVLVQYVRFIKSMAVLDFKTSINIQKHRKVSEIIAQKLPISIMLGFIASVFGIVIGLILGIFAALKRGKIIDQTLTILAVLGVSMPSIVVGILLQYIFAVKLSIAPVSFKYTWISSILPVLALSFLPIAVIARYMRNELIEVLSCDYILFAKAKGVPFKDIVIKHALRNALIPVITICGPLIVSVMIGSLIIEHIFGIAGFGDLLVRAAIMSDYPVILACVWTLSVIFTLTYLIIDLLYGIIDPRIRLQGEKDV
jgi:oligopeptide transport system permease protein